jgi:hypothetical protein
MLEKPEGAIKNGQSRDIGNIVQARHRTKTNKRKHNTTQKTRKMSNTNPTKNTTQKTTNISTTDTTKTQHRKLQI